MNTTTSKKQITDLAELRSAIRQTRDIVITLRDREGEYVTFVRVTKKEALHLTQETNRLDDYAADLDEGYLYLNGTELPNLRAERAPIRRAARLAELLAKQVSYQRAEITFPDFYSSELAALQSAPLPPAPSLVLEHGTATVRAIAVA